MTELNQIWQNLFASEPIYVNQAVVKAVLKLTIFRDTQLSIEDPVEKRGVNSSDDLLMQYNWKKDLLHCFKIYLTF